ncbi:C-type lectin domain family 4 member M-like [Oncorhynchus kisutch]|uniref:C-type lectin domain family 4 member M-like n=1 Tax=Oncorhynchus kisutch TaxID=8019 RepID=A0A8C7GXE2_ONCKI|nr:C-type lectin domain family 4 member M-like [Oncorhynchus kisutch]XP_031670780.1 C-type lectin domain family 4 member M-like [Oncorhynchus kisutch]
MSEGVYENSNGFKDDEPDAMKNTDIDGQLYANVRDFKASPKDGVVASVHVQWWKRPSGVAAVCLGLLCVLLLAGIIGLAVYYGIISQRDSTERDLLQASYSLLTNERDQLQTSYNNMTEEKDHLQTRYNSMTEERDLLQACYSLLTNKRDQLQTSYNKMTEEKDQLQTSCNSMTEERDQLQTRVRLSEEPCLAEWWKFGTSCYYVSSKMNTPGAGQKECRTMGGELVVINSREEQIFINGFKKNVWIGIYKKDGIWKWVDSTPFTTTYWMEGEPNNFNDEVVCVEISQTATDPLKCWKDGPCVEQHWVCEKPITL